MSVSLIRLLGAQSESRYWHSMDVVDDRTLLIFGGCGKGTYKHLDSLFCVDTENCQAWYATTHSTAPCPRGGHTGTVVGRKLLVHGGVDDTLQTLSDLHALDLASMTWFEPQQRGDDPPARRWHTATRVGSQRLMIWGGWDGTTFRNDLVVLNTETLSWSTPKTYGTPPPPLAGHSTVNISGALYVFGGAGLSGPPTNQLWIFNTETMAWSCPVITDPPPPRRYHTAVALAGKMFVFGGAGTNNEALNDVFVLDTVSLSWHTFFMKGIPPAARMNHAMAVVRKNLYIFGGYDGRAFCDELFMINVTGVAVSALVQPVTDQWNVVNEKRRELQQLLKKTQADEPFFAGGSDLDPHEVPPTFLCPLTEKRMRDPVVAADEHTYEREAIERWLTRHNTSPITGRRLSSSTLKPDYALLSQINQWKERKRAETGDTRPLRP